MIRLIYLTPNVKSRFIYTHWRKVDLYPHACDTGLLIRQNSAVCVTFLRGLGKTLFPILAVSKCLHFDSCNCK